MLAHICCKYWWWKNIDTLLTKVHISFRYPKFLNALFSFQNLTSRIPHDISVSLLKALLACDSFSVSLFLMNVIVLEEYRSDIFRMSHNWDFPDIFLMMRLGLWVWERLPTVANCYPHHIISSTYHQPDLSLLKTLIALVNWCLTCFSLSSDFFSFLYYTVWNKVTRCSPHLWSTGLFSTHLAWDLHT